MLTRWAAVAVVSICPTLAYADAESAWNAYRERRYNAALEELRPLAARNDPAAQYYLACMHLDGSAMRRSAAKAAELLELSARAGYAPAQFRLGFLLYHGAAAGDDTLPSDHARAMPWLLKSAEAGNPAANDLVGRAYLDGHVLARDVERAKQHLMIAAQAGIGSAQVALGTILGAEPGLASAMESYKWLWLAAAARYPGAEENLTIAATRLNQAEIAQARVLAGNTGLLPSSPSS